MHGNVVFPSMLNKILIMLFAVNGPGALCGQLRRQADTLQPSLDGHLRAANASDGSAAVGGNGEQSQSC